jgi:Spy/CpxP family protein refolding chaperone
MEATMKKLHIVLIFVVAIGFGASATAAGLDLPPGKWWENPRLVQRLGLSEEQQQAIRGDVFEHAKRLIDLTAAVRKSELELAELVAVADFDTVQVRQVFGEYQKAKQALELERFEMLLAIRAQLTDSQWEKIQTMRQEMMRRRGQQGRRGGGQQMPNRRPPGGGV